MFLLAKYRSGRAIIHLLSIAHCINHFMSPKVLWHLEGILREVKGI
jgi:hypothetical protein